MENSMIEPRLQLTAARMKIPLNHADTHAMDKTTATALDIYAGCRSMFNTLLDSRHNFNFNNNALTNLGFTL